MEKKCIGIDVGGTTVKIGIFETDGTLVYKWEVPSRKEENGAYILPDVAASIRKKLNERGIPMDAVIGAGMGFPGPVQPDGYVEVCVNLGWRDLNPQKILSELLDGMPVRSGNDANVAALGEMWQGGGKGCHDIVMVTLGTGVGGGVVHDQKIVAGRHGCLEQVASATGIAREARRKMAAKPDASVMRAYGDAITAKNVLDAAKAGDALALEVMDTVCYYLGWALATISMTVDPEIFVIGGGVSKAGTFLTDWIDRYYRELTPISENKGEVRLATLGNDAGIYGAARLILD